METIEATAEETVYRNEDNGYTVLAVKVGRTRVSAVGIMPEIGQGEHLVLSGDWVEHPVYGRQIKVRAIAIQQPSTTTAIERYLSSGLIRGIGEHLAHLIVETFGTDTLTIMATDPERLLEIRGIGPKSLQMITESYQEHHQKREAMLFLSQYDISPSLGEKIIKRYGENVRQVILANPYRLIDDIEGIGFKTADRIAASIGIEPESGFRLSAGIRHTLRTASDQGGHCYLPRPLLLREAARLLDAPQEMLEDVLDQLILEGLVKAEILPDAAQTLAIYDPRAWRAEQGVAVLLCQLTQSPLKIAPPREAEVDERIEEVERNEGWQFHEAQKDAIRRAIRESVCVITGGPGTGKTTIIKCILRILGADNEIELGAPTGRAAKRMTEACGQEARTIHRLLEYGGEEGAFQRDDDTPLTCDTVIIDEMSMVDIYLMRALLSAIEPGTRVILVGDADQLPSVGAGNVLRDILSSQSVPRTILSEIFRQEGESMIVYNAHQINHGFAPRLNAKEGDFFFERTQTAQQTVSKVLDLVTTRLPAYLSIHQPIQSIQVLAPMKKGDCGVWELNRKLQQALNPPERGKKERLFKETVFRVGDKVMQIRNNYNLAWRKEGIFGWEEGQGVFNGDIGYVTDIDPEDLTLTVLFDDEREVTYEEGDLQELELAYCISIHKSQGSEFPVVVLPLVGGAPMLLSRNLLYTAITRAQKFVMIVGRDEVIAQMIENNQTRKRYTALGLRLCTLLQADPL